MPGRVILVSPCSSLFFISSRRQPQACCLPTPVRRPSSGIRPFFRRGPTGQGRWPCIMGPWIQTRVHGWKRPRQPASFAWWWQPQALILVLTLRPWSRFFRSAAPRVLHDFFSVQAVRAISPRGSHAFTWCLPMVLKFWSPWPRSRQLMRGSLSRAGL